MKTPHHVSIEHIQDDWGEALLSNDHAAWANGDSRSLHEVLGRAAPASLILAGITRVERALVLPIGVAKPSTPGQN